MKIKVLIALIESKDRGSGKIETEKEKETTKKTMPAIYARYHVNEEGVPPKGSKYDEVYSLPRIEYPKQSDLNTEDEYSSPEESFYSEEFEAFHKSKDEGQARDRDEMED